MVLHVDLNSFFARVEQQANPRLRNKPVGILGKGHKGARTCVCAASPEAKRFGVTSGCSVSEARRLCPAIILVPPDYPKYLDISRRFIAILESFSPWVEIFSIDEAYLALRSNVVRFRENLGEWTPHSPEVEEKTLEAVHVAQTIKQKLHQEFGELITVSIGIAWGKVFAKLAGELQKPDGLVVLQPSTWLDRVGELPVTELCGIGRRLEYHLGSLGLRTIGDLAKADAGLFVARFGPSLGMRLWQIGQGIDNAPVLPSRNLAPPQSIGHQLTLDQRLRFDQTHPILAKLTTKVGRRLRRSSQAATQIALHVSLANGRFIQSTERHQPSIFTDSDLLRSLKYLIEKLVLPPSTTVERLGVVVFGLEPAQHQPLPLFPQTIREIQLAASLDQLRDRYGDQSIGWGSDFGVDFGAIRDWRGPHAVLGR